MAIFSTIFVLSLIVTLSLSKARPTRTLSQVSKVPLEDLHRGLRDHLVEGSVVVKVQKESVIFERSVCDHGSLEPGTGVD